MSNEDETIFLPLSIVISVILITSFLSTTSQFEQKALVESSNSNLLSKVPTIGKLISGRLRRHVATAKMHIPITKVLARIHGVMFPL
jgi:hypothetical protein